jgi:polygalacturonase
MASCRLRLALLLLLLLLHSAARSLDVDVEAFGAKACTGDDDQWALMTTAKCPLSTAAFMDAIGNVSAAGGGVVHARGPGMYVTTGIEMKSHVTLQIHVGATVNGSHSAADWSTRKMVPPACDPSGAAITTEVLGSMFYASLASNFTIRGPGAVNGAAKYFNVPPPQHRHTNPHGLDRGHMFAFTQCTDVVMEDLHIQDSSGWTLNPRYSKRLSFRRLRIDAPALGTKGHNTDGFDPWGCEDAEFIDSYYAAGDDCVAVKSGANDGKKPWSCGTKYPSRNIRINNITCDGSHGLTVGSEVSGGIENVSFTNIRISNSGPPVRIKSQCGRGAFVRNILYENITAKNVDNAVWIDMDYVSVHVM